MVGARCRRGWSAGAVAVVLVIGGAVPAGGQETEPTTTTSSSTTTSPTTTSTSVPEQGTTTTTLLDPHFPGDYETDPTWAATATLRCGAAQGTVVVESLDATVREGQEPVFYWGPPDSGVLWPVAVGDVLADTSTLFWQVHEIPLGPWPVVVTATCIRTGASTPAAPPAGPGVGAGETLPVTGTSAVTLTAAAGVALLSAGLVLARQGRRRQY